MKSNDYDFGETTVSCDAENCNEEITIDGFDGQPSSYEYVNKQLKEEGWNSTRRGGEWVDYCPKHV